MAAQPAQRAAPCTPLDSTKCFPLTCSWGWGSVCLTGADDTGKRDKCAPGPLGTAQAASPPSASRQGQPTVRTLLCSKGLHSACHTNLHFTKTLISLRKALESTAMRNFVSQLFLCRYDVNVARYKELPGSWSDLERQILDLSPFSSSEESVSPIAAPRRLLGTSHPADWSMRWRNPSWECRS